MEDDARFAQHWSICSYPHCEAIGSIFHDKFRAIVVVSEAKVLPKIILNLSDIILVSEVLVRDKVN